MFTMIRAQIVFVAFFFLALTQNGFSQSSPVILSMDQPGIAIEDRNTLLIAFPIVNNGTATAYNVEITAISLQSAKLIRPTAFPVALGNLMLRVRTVGEAAFLGPRLLRNQRYLLEVKGKYVVEGKTLTFSVHRYISLPPSAPGSARISTTEARPNSVSGASYPHRDAVFPPEVNAPGPPVPTGRRRGNLRPTTTATTVEAGRVLVAGSDTWRDQGPIKQPETSHPTMFLDTSMTASHELAPQGQEVVFVRNTAFGSTGGVPNDPSGASGGFVFNGPQTVLATGNTYASFSTDGGSTFRQLDPTTIFPNNFDGGLCCDQVVHYSHSVNRFIWLMLFRSGANGQNRLRIASASPEALIASKGTAWTYWDLTSALFNLGNNSMDFPDLAVGDNFLYVSVDGAGGLLVARIPLTELRDGATIHIGFTNPADGTSAYGRHLVQNAGNEIFWPGVPEIGRLRIFSLKEGSNSYFWRDVPVNSYPVEYTSTSPDGTDWLASLFYTGPTGTRVFNLAGVDEIWIAWGAGRGGGFPQAHVQLVRIRHSNFSVIEQTQLWNANFAFGLPSLTTSVNGVVGLSLAFGGGNFFGSPAVGIIGQGVVYSLCASSANAGRYGDYSAVRQAFANGDLFSAEGYCVTPGPRFDPHYVLFGRRADVNPAPISSIDQNIRRVNSLANLRSESCLLARSMNFTK
ncbi:MAG TPA: hypothetical protein VHE60_10565 [Pyrinomonadaceae bacterium]|nr:hypothetical protein [Pyrinomonadaceae bacterium]